MRKRLTALCFALATMLLSYVLASCAADTTKAGATKDCTAQADERTLAGSERDRFVTECEQNQPGRTTEKPRRTYGY